MTSTARPRAKRFTVLLAIGTLVAALAALSPLSRPAQAIQFGGNSGATPNIGHGCEAIPFPNSGGFYQPVASGQPSCSYFQLAPLDNRSGASPAPRGRVTLVRVRTGNNPAPLRFTVMQARTGLDAQGNLIPGSTQCCFGEQQTRTIALRPNRVNVIPLNLPMENRKRFSERLSVTDYVGFSASSGAGEMPIRVIGSPHFSQSTDFSRPQVKAYYPEILPGAVRDPGYGVPDFRLTTEFTFCTVGGGNGRVAARNTAGTCGGRIATRSAKARSGSVKIPISCVGACSGKIEIKKKNGKGTLGKTKKFSVRPGAKGTTSKSKIKVKLTKAGRNATKGKRKVKAKVVIRTQGAKATKQVTIR